MKCLIVLLVSCSIVFGNYVSYEGYKVYKVNPTAEEQLVSLKLLTNNKDFDFWSQPKKSGDSITIMVAPKSQEMFKSLMKTNNVDFSILIENVEETLVAERKQQNKSPKVELGEINFTEYHRYHIMQHYLVALANKYPEFVTMRFADASFEARSLYLAVIGTKREQNSNPIIFIDGGIHAREWISPAVVMYIIQELIENQENRYLIENVDWYITPVLNPDGYEYTHTDDRFWRKTRTPGNVTDCFGVDPNRNFDFHWMEVGASSDECSEIFAGPTPFSERETRYLRNQILQLDERIKLYLTFHSFGQYLLYPWGYTSALPDNVDQLHELAVAVDEAISAVNGTRYVIGSSTNVLYPAAGGSDDWVKAVGGVDLSYTIELPGGGTIGFDLPPTRILPVCEETFEGIRVFHDYIANKYRKVK